MPIFNHKNSSMENEIFEQKELVQKILDTYISQNELININLPDNISRVIIVASGSSYHCARYMADLFGSIINIEARAIYSSEFLLKSTIENGEGVFYIFITQSGETSDTNAALLKANEVGVKTLCITNKENSSIWNSSQYQLACHAGEEKSIAATKSLTAQMVCAMLVVFKTAQNKGIDVKNYIRDLNEITDVIENALTLQNKIKQVAKFLSKHKNIVVTADGASYALAKEASLKIKETSFINTCSYILGEFMHGHVAILNNNRSALIYILNDELNYTTIKNITNIKENYKTPIILIGNRNNQIKSSYNIDLDCKKPLIKTFGLLVIIQLLALETALKLHRNIDKPHGLNKIVK